ncbi:MAG: Lsm family RNA-binding protein [Candidatus Lokiarchaeota archaeon]|nr:Lsm family RNA-binding protein [Candidatus Lokiarchaeota archaeon]
MSIGREYNTELQKLIDKTVKVYIDNEKYFVGLLKGVSENSNLILSNVKDNRNKPYPTILIQNSFYSYMTIEDEPFPMEALADRIATIFSKGHVSYKEDQNLISILNGKILVDENGVRGEGPSAERVKKIFEQFKLDLE